MCVSFAVKYIIFFRLNYISSLTIYWINMGPYDILYTVIYVS